MQSALFKLTVTLDAAVKLLLEIWRLAASGSEFARALWDRRGVSPWGVGGKKGPAISPGLSMEFSVVRRWLVLGQPKVVVGVAIADGNGVGPVSVGFVNLVKAEIVVIRGVIQI